MDFSTYLNQGWNDHVTDSNKVAESFAYGSTLVQNKDQLTQFVGLVTHVMGEHLARWQEGAALLASLKDHPQFQSGTDAEQALLRSIAALQLGGGQPVQLNTFSISDQIRIQAVAASALAERDSARAQVLLEAALKLADRGLDAADPANRALAITGNNLAAALEEEVSRTPADTQLMLLAAKVGRKYWEIAGTWTEVSWAEYRLAMSHLKANELVQSQLHAQKNLELIRLHQGSAVEWFFGFEAMALVEKAKANSAGFQEALVQAKHHFEQLAATDKGYYEKSLRALES